MSILHSHDQLEPRFAGLGAAPRLAEQLRLVFGLISMRFSFIDRVAVAIYDADTDLLKTFVSSNQDESAQSPYEVPLAELPALAHLAHARARHLVGEISDTFRSGNPHTEWLRARDYQSNCTTPVFQGDDLVAFLFYDSRQAHAFSDETAQFLDTFSELIGQLFLMQRRITHGLAGTIQLAVDLARIRDFETGQHLERIAYYSRIMARALASEYGLTDEYIEYLQLFAPLHDIGKVGIPDHILLKPDRLEPQEYEVMKRHVTLGENIITRISRDMGLSESQPARIMYNIVATHHERGDGSGYPRGLTMAQIPLEGRIVAVADVYDALTNHRAYKDPWTEEMVVAEMLREAQTGQLDATCVQALVDAHEARAAVRLRFADRQAPVF